MRKNTREYDWKYYERNKDKILNRIKNNQKKDINFNAKRMKRYYINPIKDLIRGWTRYHFKKEVCRNCGSSENLEFHHLKYMKVDNSFIVLCRKCHRRINHK